MRPAPGVRHGASGPERGNGKSEKTIRTGRGEIAIGAPRDRECSFEPQLIPQHQRDIEGFDDKILSTYARGVSVREIRAPIEDGLRRRRPARRWSWRCTSWIDERRRNPG